MTIIDPLVERYVLDHSSPEDPLLRRLSESMEGQPHAHMQSGHIQGLFLEMVSRMIRPKQVLDIGTFRGYSALCLARGLQSGGSLHTIECREPDAEAASRLFEEAKMLDKIILHLGNALDIIPVLKLEWDLVFIDADKVAYADYYRLILPALNPGGWILVDNVLFHGQVLNEPLKGKNARAIAEFNNLVRNDDRVEKLLLPIRDGLFLIRKK